MRRYKVTVSFAIGSGFTYSMLAPSIAHAAAFVMHWDHVRVERVRTTLVEWAAKWGVSIDCAARSSHIHDLQPTHAG